MTKARRAYECIPNIPMVAVHLAHVTERLHLSDVASAAPRRGLRHRRHSHRRPRDLRRRSPDRDRAQADRSLIPALAAGGYEAVAICLLNAYANPAHEQALADLVGRRLQHVVLTCSSETAPEFREYERASTTVIAAHVQPVISEYLERFERHLASRGFAGSFSLMQSNGGRLPSTGMRRNPVTALFSGPAAGVMGAVRQSVQSGFASLITFDMGGTSTDVCLIQDGEPELTGQSAIDGLPVRTPLFDIVSEGAGCDSIVWRDEGGMLRVGPQSAGATPATTSWWPSVAPVPCTRRAWPKASISRRFSCHPTPECCRPTACWLPTTACSRPGPAALWSTRRLRASFATRSGEMRGRIEERLRDMGLGNGDSRMHLTLEMRFVGQAFEVPVDIDPGELDELTARALLDAFIDAHHRMYLYGAANRTAAEIVSFRLGVVSPVERVPGLRESRGDIHAPPRRHRIFDGRDSVDCTLVRRASLTAGQGLEGPGIIDDVTSTIFVPAGWRSEVDEHENLIMRRS